MARDEFTIFKHDENTLKSFVFEIKIDIYIFNEDTSLNINLKNKIKM